MPRPADRPSRAAPADPLDDRPSRAAPAGKPDAPLADPRDDSFDEPPSRSPQSGASPPAPTRPAFLRAIRPVFVGLDGLYLAFQNALKATGMVRGIGGGETVPESADDDGRWAELPEHPGRWPALRVRLPDTAIYQYAVESIFRRAGLWRAIVPLGEVRGFYRRELARSHPKAVEHVSGARIRIAWHDEPVRAMVSMVELDDGGIVISIGQSTTRRRIPGRATPLLSGPGGSARTR